MLQYSTYACEDGHLQFADNAGSTSPITKQTSYETKPRSSLPPVVLCFKAVIQVFHDI